MKIAIVQMQMKESVEENLASITASIEQASELGVRVMVFPELTTTSCHRGIRNECSKLQASPDWIDFISRRCADHQTFAFVGTPTFEDDEIRDSYLLINDRGEQGGETHKNGLTESESMIFSPGADRHVWTVDGLRIAAVICREIVDLPILINQLDSDLDILLWPGCISIEEYIPEDQEQVNYQQAKKVAREFGALLIQSNWANSVNRPEITSAGGSIVLSYEGETLGLLPQGEPGLGIYDAESRVCHWHAQQA